MLTWTLLEWMGLGGASRHSGLPALETSRSLIGLVAGLQQHRGLSSGWLAGDRTFEARMVQRRQAIEALFPVLRAGFKKETEEACPCFTLNDWRLLQFKWEELVEGTAQSSIQDNMERHSQLIAHVLNWLCALGESRIELPAGCRVARGLVRNFTVHLPALSECLGQARALGSSVAANGYCSPVAKVRLGYMVARADALLKRAMAADQRVNAALQSQRLIEIMTAMIREKLLGGAGISVSSEVYFDTATKAIDGVFAWIDHLADVLEESFQEEGQFAGKLRANAL